MTDTLASMRLDKWLWAARFYKTRALAVDEINLGRVRVGGQPVKPARDVKVGDTFQFDPTSYPTPWPPVPQPSNVQAK